MQDASTSRLRTDRLKIVVIAIFLAAAIAVYFVIQKAKLGDLRLATDKTLLMGIASILVVLTIALAWVLIRNLARVVADRRLGVAGAGLRARLAFAFLFLVMVPCLLLFTGAILIVSQALRSLAPPRVIESIESASRSADVIYGLASQRATHGARVLAAELAESVGSGTSALRREIAAARERLDLAAVGVVTPEGERACAGVERDDERMASASELCALPEELLSAAVSGGTPGVHRGELTFGWRAVAVEPLVTGEDDRGVVWAVEYLPDEITSVLEERGLTREHVLELRRRSPVFQRLLVAIFTLLTLLVLFAAVWSGLFLARAITNPVQVLVGATEALARGDLSIRVPDEGQDELANLARSFNHMAAEIQRTRRELVTRQDYIETLLAAVPVGVISLDSGGRVTTANRTALELLRLEHLPVGEPLADELDEGRRDMAVAIRPVIEGRAARLESEVTIEVDEGAASLQLIAGRIRIGKDEEGVLIVLEDLTSLRRAERFAAWGEVARRVAHEIKNPLTPIRLAAERMLRRYRKEPTGAGEPIEQGVSTIVREVDSLKNLVDEFSRFARLPELRLEPGSVADVARDALILYRESHPKISFEERLDGELPPHRIDTEAMRRCVINLLENSIAAVGNGGRILVRADSHPARNAVVLSVADNGPGLSDADRERLFLPDFSRRPGGTGLGLAIVHRIVTEHGGQIRAERSRSGGTRMVIEIPAMGRLVAQTQADAERG